MPVDEFLRDKGDFFQCAIRHSNDLRPIEEADTTTGIENRDLMIAVLVTKVREGATSLLRCLAMHAHDVPHDMKMVWLRKPTLIDANAGDPFGLVMKTGRHPQYHSEQFHLWKIRENVFSQLAWMQHPEIESVLEGIEGREDYVQLTRSDGVEIQEMHRLMEEMFGKGSCEGSPARAQ